MIVQYLGCVLDHTIKQWIEEHANLQHASKCTFTKYLLSKKQEKLLNERIKTSIWCLPWAGVQYVQSVVDLFLMKVFRRSIDTRPAGNVDAALSNVRIMSSLQLLVLECGT